MCSSTPSLPPFLEPCTTSRMSPQAPDPDLEVDASTHNDFNASFKPREDSTSYLKPIASLEEKVPSNKYPGVALFASKPLSSAPEHFTCNLEAVASNNPFATSSNPLRDPAECHETMPDLEPEPDPKLESSAPVPSLEFPLCLIPSISSPLSSPLLVSTPFYCSSLLSRFLFVSTHFSPLSAILDIHSIDLPSQVPIPEHFSHPVSYFYHSQVPTILVSPHISDSLSPSHFPSSFPPPYNPPLHPHIIATSCRNLPGHITMRASPTSQCPHEPGDPFVDEHERFQYKLTTPPLVPVRATLA